MKEGKAENLLFVVIGNVVESPLLHGKEYVINIVWDIEKNEKNKHIIVTEFCV